MTPFLASAQTRIVDLLSELKQIQSIQLRRDLIHANLREIIYPKPMSGSVHYDDRTVADLEDFQALSFLYAAVDEDSLRAATGDGRFLTRTARSAGVRNFRDEGPPAKLLRYLAYVFDQTPHDDFIKSALTPLAVAVIYETLDRDFIQISNDDFVISRLLTNLDRQTDGRYGYAKRKLDFKVVGRTDVMNRPLAIQIRFKHSLFTKCVEALSYVR